MTPPPIDELVGLLNRHAPDTIKRLEEQFPAAHDLLRPGIIAGDTPSEMGVRVEAALAGLTVAVQVCKTCIQRVRKRLRAADRTQITGQLVTLVAGASIFGVLEVDVPKEAKYIAAFLALAGSVLTVFSQYLIRGFGGQNSNLYDAYSELVDCQIEGDGTLRELDIRKQTGASDQTIELIAKANALSAKVTRLESQNIG